MSQSQSFSSPLPSALEVQDDTSPVWYALQTFYCKEESVARYLRASGLDCFIPMHYREVPDVGGKPRRVLVPAVHNLLFLKKTLPADELEQRVHACPVPIHAFRRRDTGRWYEISDREMLELRAICDPDYQGTLYVDVNTAEARRGSRVRVIRGPFTGLEGRLVRYKNRSYVVVVVASLGVLVHIPKWYCRPLE